VNDRPDGVAIRIKVVPGAARDQIAGLLGGRLKLRVSAPPEGGRANRRVCELLAGTLGIRPSAVSVTAGHGSAEKTVLVRGVPIERVRELLGL
jgi:uncharacterized protein (TIGR00251 family)